MKRFSTLRVMRETALSYLLKDRAAHHAIEPTDQTAPPFGHSRQVTSARTFGLTRLEWSPISSSSPTPSNMKSTRGSRLSGSLR
jgi:hypothetical protein